MENKPAKTVVTLLDTSPINELMTGEKMPGSKGSL